MKIIYADNWKERMERCEKKNKKIKKNLIILKCLLEIAVCGITLSFAAIVVENYNSIKVIVFCILFLVYVFFIMWIYGANELGRLLDEIMGGKPMFTPIVDAGATLSYLLKEKNAKIEFENGCYSVKYEKNKEIQLKDIKIVEWGVTEPGLDLNKMEIVVPFNWLEKEEKIKWEVATHHSSDLIKELAKVKL